jgi:hypothetical protein
MGNIRTSVLASFLATALPEQAPEVSDFSAISDPCNRAEAARTARKQLAGRIDAARPC